MKKLVSILALLFVATPALANQQAQGWCEAGNAAVKTQGLTSTGVYQASYPQCTVTVYLHGTTTLASLYSDNNPTPTPLSNPYTANANGSWSFYATIGHYDVVLSGGQGGGFVTPYTLADVLLQDCSQQQCGGPGNPSSPAYSIQAANVSVNSFTSDPNFLLNPTTHTLDSHGGNMLIGALSSAPRALYDPMDTKYCATGGAICGLAAAIAAQGSTPTAPAQVINAALNDGECAIQMGTNVFNAVNVPLPSGVVIDVTGIRYWSSTSFGGEANSFGPVLQHSDSSQAMVAAHDAGDALTCSNGTTYHPASGGVGAVYLHNFQIAGMYNPATNTDIGVVLNAGASAAVNIAGSGQTFGSAAVVSNATSSFLLNIGFPGAQVQGCKTYNSGVLPVSGFSLGSGRCAAVMDISLDGGAENIYASDGQATATSSHAVGPCYPNCAAFEAGGNGTYDDNIFAQLSSVGAALIGTAVKAGTIRVDYVSREALQLSGLTSANQVKIDSACVDQALQANYVAGTATGCFAVSQTGSSGSVAYDISVVNNSGIFAPSFTQAWILDGSNGSSGTSNVWGLVRYQGNANNTTANDWMLFSDYANNDQTGPRVAFPSMPPMAATGATINASGITSVRLNGNTVTSIVGGVAGQHLIVMGSGTVNSNTSIVNLNGLPATVTCGSDNRTCAYSLEYLATASGLWVMISGPANQTPTQVNFFGNPAPTNPSLLDVYGNQQARQVPAFTISVSQLHGPASGSGQACFEEQGLFPDGSYVVTPLACTTVNLATQTSGEIFGVALPSATAVLYLVTNTEGNGVATGKYPAPTISGGSILWDGPTTIAEGGDGTAAPSAGDNNTGESWTLGSKAICPNPLPTCKALYQGVLCSVPGSGGTADVLQMCSWSGSAFAWVTH